MVTLTPFELTLAALAVALYGVNTALAVWRFLAVRRAERLQSTDRPWKL